MSTRIKPNKNPKPQANEQLENIKKILGITPNICTTLAHSPAALDFFFSGIKALSNTKISATLREQIALAVAAVNTSDYCASAHTAVCKMQKIPEAEYSKNFAGKSGDAKTEAALQFALQIVKARGKVSDKEFEAVRKAGYSDEEIVEIIAIVCQNIFTNYFNLIVGTEIDFPKVSTNMVQSSK